MEAMKAVELRWTKDEIKSYIRCNYDMLLLLAKEKKFKNIYLYEYKNASINVKAEALVAYMLRRTTSERIVYEVLKYYKKICEFTALLKLELYND